MQVKYHYIELKMPSLEVLENLKCSAKLLAAIFGLPSHRKVGSSPRLRRRWQFEVFSPLQVREAHDVFVRRKEEARPLPVLVQVQSSYDRSRQHMSVILQNGFLKLVVSLNSYNSETVRSIYWLL